MNRLFIRTLFAFFLALLLLAGLQTAAWLSGFRRSVAVWNRARIETVADTALRLLRGDSSLEPADIPVEPPLAVYDPNGRLVFANRGFGAGRGTGGEAVPVIDNGALLGFYRTGRMQFQADAANRRFVESLRRTFWVGASSSLVIAVLAGLFFSRGLTRPATRVAEGLERMARGELSAGLPEEGAVEIAQIARSANRLGGQLEREREIRRRWVQDIAHDLRTPIAALKAQFEAMRDGVLELSVQRVSRNLDEIERIQTLVLDLEELMRLESPEMRLEEADVPVAPLLEELHGRFALDMEKKALVWQQESSLVALEADPKLLQRALTNLLANAIRHAPPGGTIRAAVGISVDGPQIVVGNTGTPIPAAERERVFDRLYRGEYARNTPGSGLGLTITRRIAELHGGSVRIDDWEGRGTQVIFSLPGQTRARG